MTSPSVPDSVPAQPLGPPWASSVSADHPLVGHIWDRERRDFITPAQAVDRLAAADIVLLGEKHNNIDHHQGKAWLVDQLIRVRGRRLGVAFEMIGIEQADNLQAYLADNPDNARGIGEAVSWEGTGWPDWALYKPAAQVALDAGLPVRAANLPRHQMKEMVKKGVGVLGGETVRRLELDRPLPAVMTVAMREEILISHCNALPPSAVEGMATTQAAKDAQMAWVLRDIAAAPDLEGAILIAGYGHVRDDRGIPWHLRRHAPDMPVATLAFIEVKDGLTTPEAYIERIHANALPFDVMWFTPRTDALDPCEKYARILKRAARLYGTDDKEDTAEDDGGARH